VIGCYYAYNLLTELIVLWALSPYSSRTPDWQLMS